jgi:hypothetical protein
MIFRKKGVSVKKLFAIFLGLSFLGLIGLSLEADPAGKTNQAEKAVPAKKSVPAGNNLPAEKSTSEGQPALAEGAVAPVKSQSGDSQRQGAFKTSLHHTGRGMAFWYGKENNGLELLTGQAYPQLACKKCHVASCEGCHPTAAKTKAPAKPGPVPPETCLKCHDQLAAHLKLYRGTPREDVHLAKGMQCLDCHTSREMHGDGQEYQSQKQPGALGASCEKCHADISDSRAHRKHWKKVECQACHAGSMMNQTSTQFETLAKEGQRVSLPVTDWVFLMNRNQKLVAASLQAFVLPEGGTFLIFTPSNSHRIVKSGRKCGDCHGSAVMSQAEKGPINLSWLEEGQVKTLKGLIPVVAGATYNLVYQSYQNGKWSLLEKPAAPKIQYAGYGGPVTDTQWRKMLKSKSEDSGIKKNKKKK